MFSYDISQYNVLSRNPPETGVLYCDTNTFHAVCNLSVFDTISTASFVKAIKIRDGQVWTTLEFVKCSIMMMVKKSSCPKRACVMSKSDYFLRLATEGH